MVANVKELDAAQTELKKVSDLSGDALAKFTDDAYKAGESVARTGTQMVEAATNWKKAGYDEKEILQLSKVSSMYQNISDSEISAGDATNFIISQLKAFNIEASQSEHIIDAVNNVSNNMAVSSYDLATNIGKASAAMAAGGNTYEQTLGMMTGITEITRSGSKAARGLITIQSRYNQILDESSSTGKKLSAWYEEHGIQIKDSDGNLKSFYDTSSQVAKIWDTLSDNEKKYYANIQAGATQTQNLMALYSNYEGVIKATGLAYDSAGSAAQENERYLDSIEGKMQAFQSAWEQLSFHVISSDFLKTVIEGATDAIKVLDKLTEAVGPAGLAGVAVGAYAGVKTLANGFDAIARNGGVLEVLPKVFSKSKEGIVDTVGAFNRLPEVILNSEDPLSRLGRRAGYTGENIKEMSDEIQSVSFDKFTNGLKTLAASPLFQAGAVVAFAVAIDKLKHALSFEGKVEDIHEIDASMKDLQSEISQLESQGEALTAGDKARLQYLKAQLKILEQQREVEKQEATARFTKEAEAKLGSGKMSDMNTNAESYTNAVKGARELNDQLEEVEKKWVNGQITQEKYLDETKRITKEQKQYNEVIAESGQAILDEQANLELVDYNSLTGKAKQYYDSVHTAYLQMQNDNAGVQSAIEQVIQQVGSAEFDSWELDVSSFKSAEEFIEAVKAKMEDPSTLKVNIEEEGSKDVEKKKKKLAEKATAKINVTDNGTAGTTKSKIDGAAKNRTSIISVITSGLSTAASAIKSVARQAVQKRAGGKKKGEAGGLAWIGDQQKPGESPKPELIVKQDGSAILAGQSGWELHSLSQGDIVYSHEQTKKLLGGKMSYQFGAKEIPRFAKGTSNATKVQQLRDKWDAEMETIDYYKELNNWTPQYNLKKLQESYNKFQKQFKSLKSSMTTQQLRQYNLDVKSLKDEIKEQSAEAATTRIDQLIGMTGYNGDTASALNKIAASQKSGYITAAEAKELRGEVYKQNLEYIKKQTEAGTKSYQDLLAAAKKYWNEVGKTSEEYYESLEELRESAIDIISKNGEKREDQIGYAQQYISLQIQELERQKAITESVEDEVDARAELLKAQNQYVKVYREGKGWVYEQDAEAIKSAEAALKELQKTEENDPVQQQIDKYNEILDLFDRYAVEADFIALQNKLGISGISDIIDGSILDKEYMSKWLQDQNTWLNTYDAWVTKLDNLTAKEYEKYASGVTSAMYNDVYKQYAYDISDIYSSDVLNAQQAYLNAGIYDGVKLNASQIASAGVSNSFYIENISLPNVVNAETFLNELKTLTSSAIQSVAKR